MCNKNKKKEKLLFILDTIILLYNVDSLFYVL